MKQKKIKIENYHNFYNYYHSNYLIRVQDGIPYRIKITDYGVITKFEKINKNHFQLVFKDKNNKINDWTLFRVPITNKKMIQELNINNMSIIEVGDYSLYHEIKKGLNHE